MKKKMAGDHFFLILSMKWIHELILRCFKVFFSVLFRTQSNIKGGAFCEIRQRLSAAKYFRKKLYLKCVTRFWIYFPFGKQFLWKHFEGTGRRCSEKIAVFQNFWNFLWEAPLMEYIFRVFAGLKSVTLLKMTPSQMGLKQTMSFHIF